MEITEKVAYLKGLVDGLGIDDSTKEGKVLKVVVDVLEDISLSIDEMGTGMGLLIDQIESLDEELSEIEEDLYGDDEDDDSCGCGHHHHHGHHHHGDFDGEIYEVTCPSCGDTICIDEDMLDEGEIECPGCGEALEFDLEGEIDDSDEADGE